MGERTWFQCHHDGLAHGAHHDSFDGAWIELHVLQGQSASYAYKYGGWKIEEVTEDGTIVTRDDDVQLGGT